MAPEDLVQRWLDRLVQCDLPGLVDMYDVHAEMRAMHETFIGRDEIEGGLSFASKWIRGIAVEGVETVAGDDGAWTFDTVVKGRLGRATVRHHWTFSPGGISGHTMSLVRHDKAA